MSGQTVISMGFPQKLLDKIDSLAKAEYTTRSDFIRRSVIKATKQDEGLNDLLLDSLSDDIAEAARAAGYKTAEDFERLAKEIKQSRSKKGS